MEDLCCIYQSIKFFNSVYRGRSPPKALYICMGCFKSLSAVSVLLRNKYLFKLQVQNTAIDFLNTLYLSNIISKRKVPVLFLFFFKVYFFDKFKVSFKISCIELMLRE